MYIQRPTQHQIEVWCAFQTQQVPNRTPDHLFHHPPTTNFVVICYSSHGKFRESRKLCVTEMLESIDATSVDSAALRKPSAN